MPVLVQPKPASYSVLQQFRPCICFPVDIIIENLEDLLVIVPLCLVHRAEYVKMNIKEPLKSKSFYMFIVRKIDSIYKTLTIVSKLISFFPKGTLFRKHVEYTST